MKKIHLTCVFVLLFAASSVFAEAGIIYRNPYVFNIEHSHELYPDPNNINRIQSLKLWLPLPREWDSQRAVKILSIEPEPHAKYVDPEYGHPMLFWDFGKLPPKPSYTVTIKYRLEQYETHAVVDPNQIDPYDKTSKTYSLYTRSTRTISITPKVVELARIAVGNEKNPYLQAKRIHGFVGTRMLYKGGSTIRQKRGSTVKAITESPKLDERTGEEHYIGDCHDYSTLFVSMCRAVGIPTRTVTAIESWCPWGRVTGGHGWAEIYLTNYGWIPVDVQRNSFGHLENNKVVIFNKGRDIQIGPRAPQNGSGGYGMNHVPLADGRVDRLGMGVWHLTNIQRVKVEAVYHPDPFPADALAYYAANLYPESDAEKNLDSYLKQILAELDGAAQAQIDGSGELAQQSKKDAQAKFYREQLACHILRRLVGSSMFSDICDLYVDLRVNSGEPVSTEQFQKIAEKVYGKPLDWFFRQWLEHDELPELKLEDVNILEREDG